MKCLNCSFENPEETKFCINCGSPFKIRCPNCKSDNPPQAKFCGECGKSLTGQSTPKSTLTDDEAERRQLTVMFCDLVGSTALSEQLDPEELRDVIHVYQEACAKVIDRFEGYIGQYLGDGLLVYFGYPLAHEDDAQRAVCAGLEILEEIETLNTKLQRDFGVRLAIRLGIHTGLVVVGEMGGGERRERLALGDTLNIASRLQNLAEPNTVVISSTTHGLTQGFFVCQTLDYHALKGISQPIEVFRVLHESSDRTRFQVALTKGLTPLVGREHEVELILERWERVKVGEGQAILLSGEAGIGKSRLVQALKERLAVEPQVRIETRCSPYFQNSSLYPFIDYLQQVLEFRREDSPEEKFNKLETALVGTSALPLQEILSLFASLLSLPIPNHYPPLSLSPLRQKQKTLEALLNLLLREASLKPVLLVVEDLHWIDPSSLEFLNLLMDKMPTVRIFMLLTFRPDFNCPLSMHSYISQLTLSRLGGKQVELMVNKITGSRTLPVEVLHHIVTKTDGVPLFVEELTKMVLDSGLLRKEDGHYELTNPLPPLAIPSSLQDLLMARLDRLGPVKELAQLGAILGREFTYELLKAVSPLDEVTLQGELIRLVEAEFLFQTGIPPKAKYFFKHALIQEAAYQSSLKSKRQQYHHKIAQILEKQFPETAETQPEFLAHHYTEAGSKEEAIPYWQKAGRRAIERSANLEAIGHLTKGLELLKNMPDTGERAQQELALQITLGVPLIATKGVASPEVEGVYTRARELCQQVGETYQLFPVLFGLWRVYNARAELQTGRNLAEQLFSSAQSVKDPALLLQAHHALWTTLLYLGELTLARKHLEQGIVLYDSQQYRSHAFIYGGHDPGVCCKYSLAWVLWLLGYPEQALMRSQAAFALAQELSHPNSLAIALDSAAIIYQLCRQERAVREQAEAMITLSKEQEFRFSLAQGTIMRGWALAELGEREEGITEMRRGMAAFRGTGSELGLPYSLSLLAEVYGKGGQVEEGLGALDEALDIVDRCGERRWEAELYRIKGELLLMQAVGAGLKAAPTTTEEAESCFHRALGIAQYQKAKSLELRAAMSLSRLWQKQGKKEEARRMLADIYGCFNEGLDTRDLKDAKALLEDLSEQ